MSEDRNSVLLVIDMQEGFLNAHSRHIVPNVARLVSEFHARTRPVIFTKYINHPGSQFERLLDWTDLQHPPETDIISELSDFGRIEVSKHFYTALTGRVTQLVSSNKWNEIVICGISTESCVLKTAVDVFEHHLRPVVVSDACASSLSEDHHTAGMLVIETMIGSRQITTGDELLTLI